MNIAVLIGIPDYIAADPLPACRADAGQMSRLLAATGKFSDICAITTETTAERVKETLRDFFARYRGKPVEEAFVYFSGHGTYHTDVLLCCSDFDPQRPSSTSISNAELDEVGPGGRFRRYS